MSVPIFALDTLEQPHEVARLARACDSVGFFYLSRHGGDESLEQSLEVQTARFFSLEDAKKDAIAMRHAGAAWRGYFPVQGELTSGRPDLKEGLYFGDELNSDDPRVVAKQLMAGQNLFLPESLMPGFRDVVLAFMRQQEQIGQRVLRAIALALDLKPNHFIEHLTKQPTSLFRIFHYPAPHVDAESQLWGVGEHTDYGLITLLKQDTAGGLEVKTSSGWHPAPPVAGTFVCNLGDMLDRLTGGRFRSTPHRVRNTSRRSRYSWPFFLDPGFDTTIAPLPGAAIRPIALDAAERWDRASVHTLFGTYGDYLTAKVSHVFPELAKKV